METGGKEPSGRAWTRCGRSGGEREGRCALPALNVHLGKKGENNVQIPTPTKKGEGFGCRYFASGGGGGRECSKVAFIQSYHSFLVRGGGRGVLQTIRGPEERAGDFSFLLLSVTSSISGVSGRNGRLLSLFEEGKHPFNTGGGGNSHLLIRNCLKGKKSPTGQKRYLLIFPPSSLRAREAFARG